MTMNFQLNFHRIMEFKSIFIIGLSALVELAGYAIVHAILNRIGRKIPYCSFAVLFGIFALLILPTQKYMEKDGQGFFFPVNRKYFKNLSFYLF